MLGGHHCVLVLVPLLQGSGTVEGGGGGAGVMLGGHYCVLVFFPLLSGTGTVEEGGGGGPGGMLGGHQCFLILVPLLQGGGLLLGLVVEGDQLAAPGQAPKNYRGKDRAQMKTGVHWLQKAYLLPDRHYIQP